MQKYLTIKLENFSKARMELCLTLNKNDKNEDF